MADPGPASSPRDPFESVISLVAGPIAAVIRSFDQLRRGIRRADQGPRELQPTMQNLNVTAERVNSLLNEFEEPVRAILPQVTRTVNLAEDLATRVAGPIDQVVPGLTRLADTLSSPVLTSLPKDLGSFVEAINDLVRRLAPLGQMAESAGGLFGLRLPGMLADRARRGCGTGSADVQEPIEQQAPPPVPPTVRRRSGRHRRRSKPATKKPAAKRKAAGQAQAAPSEAGPRPHVRTDGGAAQRVTNGVATTVRSAACRARRSRLVTDLDVGGTKPRAMPWPSVGEKLPDVTTPTAAPSTRIGQPARGGRRPSTAIPTSGDRRPGPARRRARHARGSRASSRRRPSRDRPAAA